MAAYGAEVILAPSMEEARDMLLDMEERGLGHCLDQYNNEDNTDSHYRGTGAPVAWGERMHGGACMGALAWG
jgi:cysteine synthase